ncbi:E3 ubiquitin-protein ligase TRIM50-like isoform X1 [Erpetoichthys calabaricus]|uniref:E3 ubiquitin-protein ligase TRIM50-like isoform X1 n=1 Tax=Erpetoichthys calabaricus TaxID=27687 RepID=UPI00109F590F|nr:E3 ubiquitin-protein ligase TRIM50-like isoform X1 [Erpetoichthys calabaricus]
MARRCSFESLEDQLLCPICLEVFVEPLMLKCGHSYCKSCISSLAVDPFSQFPCPVCRCEVDWSSSPPNVSLARIVEALRELNGGSSEAETCVEHHNPLSLYCEQDKEVICGLCGSIGAHRSHKITPITSVYSRMKEDLSTLMTEIQTQKRKLEGQICKMAYNKSRITNESDVFKWVIHKEFGELRHYIEEEESNFVQMVELKANALISTIEQQVADMTQTLGKFQEIQSTLEQLNNENHLNFIRKYGCIVLRCREAQQQQQTAIVVYSAISFKPGFHNDDIKMTVWKRLHRRVLPAPEILKLDPLTAHPMLKLSRDNTAVECGILVNRVPNNMERFSYSYCVLANRGFSSGKHYWEIIVGEKIKWRLGLIKGTTSRKGKLPKNPDSGVWLIGLKEGRLYEAFANTRIPIPVTSRPSKIGIFLDYEKGELTFYDADSDNELGFIYSFQAELQGKVYPLFDTCWHERGTNTLPLILCHSNKKTS